MALLHFSLFCLFLLILNVDAEVFRVFTNNFATRDHVFASIDKNLRDEESVKDVLAKNFQASGQLNRREKETDASHHPSEHKSTSVPVTDLQSFIILGNMAVGTPPTNFVLNFDNAFPYLLVINASCNAGGCIGAESSGYKKNAYNQSLSTTYKADDREFSVYTFGTCVGKLATDSFVLGELSVPEQSLGVMSFTSDLMGAYPYDGFFGLGWPAAVDKFDTWPSGVQSPLQSLAPQLDNLLYTLYLSKKKQPGDIITSGLLTFGARDSKNCASDWNSVGLAKPNQWSFSMSGLYAGKWKSERNKRAVFFSSASIMVGSTRDVKWIAKAANATLWMGMYYRVKCNSISKLPDVVFTINNRNYTLPPQNYVTKYELFSGDVCLLDFLAIPNALKNLGVNWILGAPFARSYCITHNFETPALEFATAF